MMFEPTLEQLILFQRNRLEAPVRKAIENHMKDGCNRCDRQLEWIAKVMESIHGDPSVIPPEAMAVIGQRMFADHRRSMEESDPLVSHGILMFDTAWVPLPAGARAPVSGQRRLLFAADPFEVDIEISRVRKGRYDILGQLMPLDQLPEKSETSLNRRSHQPTCIDRQGLFSFEGVSRGPVDMIFQLGDRRIKLSQVPVG